MKRVLIVEDEPDLRELIQFMLESMCEATVWTAVDGKDALEVISMRGLPDVIFSDYNMPRMNGGVFYTEVRKLSATIPFVLVSSDPLSKFPEFKNQSNVLGLEKPFSPDGLVATLGEAMALMPEEASPSGSLMADSTDKYHRIDMAVLAKVGRIPVPLFLKLSDNNYLKVHNDQALFTSEERERYIAKGAKTLWIESTRLKEFLTYSAKEVFAKLDWKAASVAEATSVLSVNHALLNTACKAFGWNDELIECATRNVQTVLKYSESNPDLKNAIEVLRSGKSIRLSTHSVMLAIAMTAVLRELKWESNLSTEKLCFAAVFHDMGLSEDFFANKLTLLSEGSPLNLPDSPDKEMLLNHGKKAAEILSKWPSCPPDVDTIIKQHHERVDGTGFPLGLTANRISPLAAVFIVCEDLIYNCVENFNQDPKAYVESRKEYFSRGEFKKIHDALLASIS